MAVIAGNWKMHMGPAATRAFFQGLQLDVTGAKQEVLIFPPAISLGTAVVEAESHPPVQIGIQNIHWEAEGAFTGETSAGMAAEAGARFVLIGHSERRHVFGETDEQVALKVESARQNGLVPVVCVGETLEQRRRGAVAEVILNQLQAVLPQLVLHDGRFLVAYEPVWAIGTGETATPEDASAAHATLRGALQEALGPDAAPKVALLYGGSVKPGNAAELLGAPDVDGVLVGGASLDPGSFAQIAGAAG